MLVRAWTTRGSSGVEAWLASPSTFRGAAADANGSMEGRVDCESSRKNLAVDEETVESAGLKSAGATVDLN
jgi:hypothetical protein